MELRKLKNQRPGFAHHALLHVQIRKLLKRSDFFRREFRNSLVNGDRFGQESVADEVRPLEKLADLYVQQGVMSEARPLFLQLAELHLKTGKQPEAIALLKKLLLAEPDNLRIQVRLADLYVAMGQSGETLGSYVSAAQRALARGDQAECERLADRALQINAKNLDALVVKARAYS